MTREAGDVHFVNDGFGEGAARWRVALPIIGSGIDDHASEGRRGIISGFSGSFTAAACRHGNALAIRIEQQLLRVKPEPVCRIEWPRNSVAIDLTCRDPWNEHMPVVIGAVLMRIEVDDPRGLRIIRRIKQQELGRAAVLGKYAEIGSPLQQSSAKGKAATRPMRRLRWGIDCVLRQIPEHDFAVPAVTSRLRNLGRGWVDWEHCPVSSRIRRVSGVDQSAGMARDHQILVRLDHIGRDAAVRSADLVLMSVVRERVELQPEPRRCPADLLADGGSVLADAAGKHQSVETAERCSERADMARGVVAEQI